MYLQRIRSKSEIKVTWGVFRTEETEYDSTVGPGDIINEKYYKGTN